MRFFKLINSIYILRFLSSPRTMGSIVSSSRWLCNAMLESVDFNKKISVVELGAGSGVITKKILNRLTEDSILHAFEIDVYFQDSLLEINDPRLCVHRESAEYISLECDAVISGIPFLSIDRCIGIRILESIRASLSNDGVFIMFQYTTKFESILSIYFNWHRKVVFFNIPPSFVYYCKPKINISVF